MVHFRHNYKHAKYSLKRGEILVCKLRKLQREREINYRNCVMFHEVMEAQKSHKLLSASSRTKKVSGKIWSVSLKA